ncbi:MAG: hypothetical protein LC118_10550 [Dehalococcoidia bacterium]|nr:hypothetical protein [Dehalococcoidia bacterium]
MDRDLVTEAGFESFPASDPPSFTATSGAGEPDRALRDADIAERWQTVFTEVDLEKLPEPGQVHLALLDASHLLEEALEGCQRTEDDGEHVVNHLIGLREELGRHRANIRTQGLTDEIATEGPWLLSHVEHLLQHHDKLDLEIARAHAEFRGEEDIRRATDRVCRRAKSILASLQTMLTVEHSLIMAQFCEPPAHD